VRLAQIIDRVHVSGGAERLQRTFAEAIDPKEVELTVITLRESPPESEAELRDLGVRVASFPAQRFSDLSRARALVRFVRDQRFDLLHAHLVRATILAGIAGPLSGTPVVATLHNTRRRSGVGTGLQIAERCVLRGVAQRVIAVGWETARAQRDLLGVRDIDVIPNAVGEPPALSARERAETRRALGVPDGAPLLISVGRLVPQKAISDLLRAFAQLRGRDPAPELRIVGKGRLESALAREIAGLGLGAHARLLGLRSDVPRLLAASDVYVSSSHWEGLPIAILEAMAAGLPVVSTEVGDAPRAIGPESGVLVAPGDPAALARAIADLLDDPVRLRQLGAAGRARARAKFSSRAWVERHMALYAEVLGHREGRGVTREESPCAS
jgi:glycosyltransferase involved in cell wall biosynthesis